MVWVLVAFVLGVVAAAGVGRVVVVRHLARVRGAERRARSAERLAEIGAMTSGLAHEIKNPLSTIGLNAQLLAEGLEELRQAHPSAGLADEVRRLGNRVGALRREADRLRGILEDFLEFAGQVRPDVREVDARSVVDEVAEFYRPEAERLGVRLRADVAAGPVPVRLDPRLIQQALLNLMINATQAMAKAATATAAGPGGGGAAGAEPAGDLMLRVQPGRQARPRTVCFEVIDTGPGIAADVLARIFEPYFTTKPGGSGLGLPTSRRLVEAHGGHIDVQSEPGKGTRFVIELPADGPSPTGPGSSSAERTG